MVLTVPFSVTVEKQIIETTNSILQQCINSKSDWGVGIEALLQVYQALIDKADECFQNPSEENVEIEFEV